MKKQAGLDTSENLAKIQPESAPAETKPQNPTLSNKSEQMDLPKKTLEEFETILEEFFNSFEIEDLRQDLEETQASKYHTQFIILALRHALRDTKRANALRKDFFSGFDDGKVLKRDQFLEAYRISTLHYKLFQRL